MFKFLFSFVLVAAMSSAVFAETVAQRRAAKMGNGMNLSYLDNYWNGTKALHFVDFADPNEAAKREPMFAEIAAAGFKTVRIPVCFSAWMTLSKPYKWERPQALVMADRFVDKALAAGLNVIVDLHHTEFDNSIPNVGNTERVVALWTEIAKRYKKHDAERLFFELRNEPRDMSAAEWRAQATQLIATVRTIAPEHTLIVGFHDWNSRAALLASEPFADPNIVYTFHYYDPFVFTHQGATWAGDGFEQIAGVPFPAEKGRKLKVPAEADGKWPGSLLRSYADDSRETKMFADVKAVSDWSNRHKVPVFAGEFGSFSKNASEADRCRHADVVYRAFRRFKIPNAWWEWDGGFSMFVAGSNRIAPCFATVISDAATSAGRTEN